MLTAVIIILREFLEASLLISVLLVLQKRFLLYRLHILLILICSLLLSAFYAASLGSISEWFLGSGQEIVTGILLVVVSLLLGIHVILFNVVLSRNLPEQPKSILPMHAMLLFLSALGVIIFSVIREGSEVIIYLHGFTANPHHHPSAIVVGGIIGGGLGICLGVLIFFSLYFLPSKILEKSISVLLILISAGLMTEAMQCFIQANLILADIPVWDSSNIIAETSVTGQLLHAIFAYEATPTREEMVAWLSTILLLLSAAIFTRRKKVMP